MAIEACYERFAHVYDHCMTDAPYERWVAYIHRLLTAQCKRKRAGSRMKNRTQCQAQNQAKNQSQSRMRLEAENEILTVLDLACGTGNITIPLLQKGYDLIGVDRSVDMLAEAREKAEVLGYSPLLLAQDMRELDLYGTVDAVLCVCDGMNYLLNDKEVAEVINRVATFLHPGGLFIFDMNTEYKFKDVLRDQTFTAVYGDVSYIWKNRYDPATGLNEYNVTFFIQNTDGTSEHFEETHQQRAYPAEQVTELLRGAGLVVQSVNEAYTDKPLAPDTERMSFVANKPM